MEKEKLTDIIEFCIIIIIKGYRYEFNSDEVRVKVYK